VVSLALNHPPQTRASMSWAQRAVDYLRGKTSWRDHATDPHIGVSEHGTDQLGRANA
jgi:hypothetical protein